MTNNRMMAGSQYVTLKQVVAEGRLSRRQAYRLAARGVLTLFKRHGCKLVHVDLAELENALAFRPMVIGARN